MKLKNHEIVDAAGALKTLVRVKLPVRASYKIAKLVIAVQQAARPFDVAKAGIIEQHAAPEQNGAASGTVSITPEGVAAYNELLGIETEVEAELLALDDLTASNTFTCPKCGHVHEADSEIEPAVLVGLGPLLSDG